jgi:hypothetical protein
MQIFSRRHFIHLLGLSSIVSVAPFRKVLNANQINVNNKIQDFHEILLNKKKSIKTISYTVSQKIIYENPQRAKYSISDIPPLNMKYEVVSDFQSLKAIMYIPTEKTPASFGAKVTYIWHNGMKHEKRESLDGSFIDDYIERKLRTREKEIPSDFLEEIFPMPKDRLMSLAGQESIGGITYAIIIQGDSKYWIHPEKAFVLKKEIYRDSTSLLRCLEYFDHREYQGMIFLPSLVREKNYAVNHILLEEVIKEISKVIINEPVSSTIFYI